MQEFLSFVGYLGLMGPAQSKINRRYNKSHVFARVNVFAIEHFPPKDFHSQNRISTACDAIEYLCIYKHVGWRHLEGGHFISFIWWISICYKKKKWRWLVWLCLSFIAQANHLWQAAFELLVWWAAKSEFGISEIRKIADNWHYQLSNSQCWRKCQHNFLTNVRYNWMKIMVFYNRVTSSSIPKVNMKWCIHRMNFNYVFFLKIDGIWEKNTLILKKECLVIWYDIT